MTDESPAREFLPGARCLCGEQVFRDNGECFRCGPGYCQRHHCLISYYTGWRCGQCEVGVSDKQLIENLEREVAVLRQMMENLEREVAVLRQMMEKLIEDSKK